LGELPDIWRGISTRSSTEPERVPRPESRNPRVTPGIERSTFGAITIDGKTYEHDVVIRLSGEVMKRKKKLSKNYYVTSHVLSKKEAKLVCVGLRVAHCWLGPWAM